MPKFLKKPVVIEAVQWIGTNIDEICSFTKLPNINVWEPERYIFIPTLEGDMKANLQDWIIRGVKGELYPCKPNIFDLTYEPVTD